MTNRPKAIGTACETAVVRYLNGHGFPGAERPALHGSLDEGDVTGCPGVAVEVKGGHAAENASDAQVDAWLAELETERVNKGADVGILVMKRKGKGGMNAGLWWTVMPGWTYYYLADGAVVPQGFRSSVKHRALPAARMTLANAVTLLRLGGYGDPLL